MNQDKLAKLEQIIHRDHDNIAGMVVQKNGETAYEAYFNGYTAGNALHVFSVTKSVVNALIGIAIDRGLLQGVGQKVLDFFPGYKITEGEKTIGKVTIGHLLTMTAPYKYETEPYEKFFTSQNPIQDALDLLGGDKSIGEFNYSAIGGTQILSGILVKATGRPMLEFAKENLFSPLGIRVPNNVILRSKEEHFAVMNDKNTRGWAVDPQGFNTAGWGLFLTPVEMARYGQLYLQHGVWNGRQIVPAEWIDESTREHSRWGELKYGYLWWVIDETERSYAAMGDGGNVIYVNSAKNLVVAIASLFVPHPGDRIGLIKEVLEPMLENK